MPTRRICLLELTAAAALLATYAVAAEAPTFHVPETYGALPSPGSEIPIGVADMDGDGVRDLVFCAAVDKVLSLTWLRGLGAGAFEQPLRLAKSAVHAGGVLADVDGDGDVDYVAGPGFLLVNDGTGTCEYGEAPYLGTSLAAAYDFEAGGATEFVAVGSDDTLRVLAYVAGQGLVTVHGPVPAVDGAPFAADMDGDERDDVVLIAFDQVDVLLRRDHGFERRSLDDLTHAATSRGASVGDFDGDGDVDVLLRDLLLENDGSGALTPGTSAFFPPGTPDSAQLPVDLDNDGDLDFVSCSGGALVVLWNDGGTLVVGEPIPAIGSGSATYALVGDVDGNGRPDVVLSQSHGTEIAVVRQSGGPPPGSPSVTSGTARSAGAQLVRITGANFAPGVTVTFDDGSIVTAVTLISDTELEVAVTLAAGGGAGPRSFTVRNPDGQVARGSIDAVSLSVAARSGRLRLSDRPGRDALRLSGFVGRTSLSAVAPADSIAALVADGLTLRLGDAAAALTVTVPAGDPGWRAPGRKGRAARWSSAEGVYPRVRLRVSQRTGAFRLRIEDLDHPDATPEVADLTFATGADAGSVATGWRRARTAYVLE